MSRVETLQVQLPKAMDLGHTMVGSREFPLSIFPYIANYYTGLLVGPIEVIPGFAPVQVWVYREDVELGRYASRDGYINISEQTGVDSPLKLVLFNLSVDTSVMVSIKIEGILYAVQG